MRLGLGTVQFGVDYGISNPCGKPSINEVAKILNYAVQAGIATLDTASLYGDSEAVLGSCLPPGNHFSIVTKTPKFLNDPITERDLDILESTFYASLEHLKLKSLYGLLLHNTDDLFRSGGNLIWRRMEELKARGLVSKIGISVYTNSQIERALEHFPVDLVQAPFNVLDQRLLAGNLLKNLHDAGIEVHSRSTFLQGLLLMPLATIPPYFIELLPVLAKYHEYIEGRGLSLLEASLAFVLAHKEIDKLIIGVVTQKELAEIVDASQTVIDDIHNFSQFSCSEERFINPSLWKIK